LITKKIHDKGYRSIHAFTEQNKNNFHRNPLSRALNGDAVPNLSTLNSWCKALECTPAESAEIIASIATDEEERPAKKKVAA